MTETHTTKDSTEVQIFLAIEAGCMKEAVKAGGDPKLVLERADSRYGAGWIDSRTRRWLVNRIK